MHTANPSKQRKRHSKTIARQGKSEARKGGTSNRKFGGGQTAGQLKSRFFIGNGSGDMSVPQEVTHKRTNKKTNRARLSTKAKHKRRLKSKG